MSLPTLALFDLDHTLLSGDSDVLWCQFLVTHGLLPDSHLHRNAELEAAYRAGTVSVVEFSAFFVATLAGRSPAQWAPWFDRFLAEAVWPRIPPDALALVEQHRQAGHLLVLTTATNRAITERTAAALRIPHLIATEAALAPGPRNNTAADGNGHADADAVYTGQTEGVLNMRQGKVQRLQAWLAQRGATAESCAQALAGATFYSDSINDLPLLSAVGHPVAIDPDPQLHAHAQAHGWPVRNLRRG